jgi:preprotein translocase subunit SecB
MAEPNPTPTAPSGAKLTETAPMLVQAQYIKDLSFENPRAPQSFTESRSGQPSVDINVDVGARPVQEKTYEVVLAIRAEAKVTAGSLFVCEVQYAGLFTVGDVPKEAVEPMLLIQAPMLLFPFARAVIANSVREGGFAALMVQPIDFAQLFRQKKAAATAGAPAGATNGSGEKA